MFGGGEVRYPAGASMATQESPEGIDNAALAQQIWEFIESGCGVTLTNERALL